jgi:AraC family transcriptional regulator
MAKAKKQSAASAPTGLNPSGMFSGDFNALVSGSSRRYHTPDFPGPLSIKAALAGSVTWETAGRSFVVRENSYLVMNDVQPYTMTMDSSALSTTLCVFFQHGFVEEVHRAATQPDSALLDSPAIAAPGSLLFHQRIEPEPSSVLAELRYLYDVKSRGQISRTANEEAFLRIARALVRELPRTNEAASCISAMRASTREELLRRVLRGRDFLLSRMDESVSIADAARAACMSQFHFLRAFRDAFHATPHQFLTKQRLERAHMLLRNGKHSVTDVCLESGFQSLGSFSTLFRRHFGVSPQQVQRGFATAVVAD